MWLSIKMPSKRSQKVAGLLKAEIGHIIQTRMKDPRIGFVTITDVVLSDDLRIAKVYFSVLGDNVQKEQSMKGLMRGKAFIQNELSSRIRLRYLPVLQFHADESWNHGTKIDRILKDLDLDFVIKDLY